MKEYTRDIAIIVSNTVTNLGVQSRLYILMNWGGGGGHFLVLQRRYINNNNNSYNNNNNNNNNKIKLFSERWNQSQFYI